MKFPPAVTRRLAGLLGVEVDLDDMRLLSDEYERRLTTAVQQKEELAEHIKKLEENYDKEYFDTEMGDLQQWLQRQGIRLD